MHPTPQHVKAHIHKIATARQKLRLAAARAARKALQVQRDSTVITPQR